ncbi:MAG: dihydrofolate reductase family protein [Gemmatimonadota bacterium]|nr:dihydrofolate reductase family protein [Gemmatimonadota bacterium]MDH4350585.1 dihydrofolate reductase family protein [Gemmatimonadota bacterium]
MRRVKLFIATSLDGFIARPDGGVDWLFTDGDFGMKAFFATVDAALIGRKTHDQMVAWGMPAGYEGMTNYVFSRSRRADDGVPVTYVTGDLPRFVGALKRQEGKDLWLVGGAGLVDAFRELDLIDDVILSVHPILLGDGIPLFPDRHPPMPLVFERCVEYERGLVQLWYRKAG